MKLYPIRKCKQGCEADVVAQSDVLEAWRSGVLKRARQVHHFRERDGARWWHWSDQRVVRP